MKQEIKCMKLIDFHRILYTVTQKAELIIYLNEEEFKRVDEDLFYRNRKGNIEDFIPSEGEIDINFDGVKIIIKQRD